MTEVRPITIAERERYLRLLCDIFDLDYNRANSVFFSEPMLSFTAKWALFRNGQMMSILTTVPVQFGWGAGIGIAGVGTDEQYRGEGLGAMLLREVLAFFHGRNAGNALLFARKPDLYERLGFEVLDHVVRADLTRSREDIEDSVEYDQIQQIYDEWAAGDSFRLRRDKRRWDYWRWNLRVCSTLGSGYLCLEGDQVREALPFCGLDAWPVPRRTEFFGLRSMAEKVQAPIGNTKFELYFMGRGFSRTPEMFMTDQF